jgi:hypothetical protein
MLKTINFNLLEKERKAKLYAQLFKLMLNSFLTYF